MKTMDGRVALDVTRLKDLRMRLGLSQEKAAEQCISKGIYVSISSIKRAELGMNVLYRTANNLALFYQIDIKDILIDPQLIEQRHSA
ncbi:XRE family transcriptional regulator [Marinomonas mediterranea]|nr:XRE family transcriptional regulator [Marinomonas mediterranea]